MISFKYARTVSKHHNTIRVSSREGLYQPDLFLYAAQETFEYVQYEAKLAMRPKS